MRLSAAVSASDAPRCAAALAEQRATTPDRLRRAAARRPRDDRRQGAEEESGRTLRLGRGVRRRPAALLDHQPIAARPDTLRYRAAKFVRRHWRRSRPARGARWRARRRRRLLHAAPADRARSRPAAGRQGDRVSELLTGVLRCRSRIGRRTAESRPCRVCSIVGAERIADGARGSARRPGGDVHRHRPDLPANGIVRRRRCRCCERALALGRRVARIPARAAGAEPQRPRRAPSRDGQSAPPRTAAAGEPGGAAAAARQRGTRMSRSRSSNCRARAPGPRPRDRGRAARARGARHPPEDVRRRASRNGDEQERARGAAAAARRPRRRRAAAARERRHDGHACSVRPPELGRGDGQPGAAAGRQGRSGRRRAVRRAGGRGEPPHLRSGRRGIRADAVDAGRHPRAARPHRRSGAGVRRLPAHRPGAAGRRPPVDRHLCVHLGRVRIAAAMPRRRNRCCATRCGCARSRECARTTGASARRRACSLPRSRRGGASPRPNR